jgi:Fe-S-cluster containining protein
MAPNVKRRRATAERMSKHPVLPIYRDIDAAIADELSRLRATDVEPSCKKGCFDCCRGAIPVTVPEARLVAQHVMKLPMRATLRTQVMARFDWLQHRLPQLVSRGMNESAAVFTHGPTCPMLVDGACSVYPVRPAICRTHFVRSDPNWCAPSPGGGAQRPVVIDSIHAKTTPHVQRIRRHIEAGGDDFWESVGPLARLVAAELGWDGGRDDAANGA